MNISKFTQKSLEAVQNLEKTAYDLGIRRLSRSICFTICSIRMTV